MAESGVDLLTVNNNFVKLQVAFWLFISACSLFLVFCKSSQVKSSQVNFRNIKENSY